MQYMVDATICFNDADSTINCEPTQGPWDLSDAVKYIQSVVTWNANERGASFEFLLTPKPE